MKQLIRKLCIRLYRKLKNWEKLDTYEQFRKKYQLHTSFRFNGDGIRFYGNGDLIAGEKSYIGSLSTIQISKDYFVKIGRNCRISHNVRIYTCSTIPDQDFSNLNSLKRMGNVVIEDNVWIGANVFINPGITIGENSVVGANSVVTKDIPPFSIYGGVPAKLIRKKQLDA
ncbi:MAG TPA: acyltransferase [Flavisolibacter sp.]|nr:acyltransferase [Flavisolibacter sp.]